MEDNKIKVLVKLDEHKGIIEINSSVHEREENFDVVLDAGFGEKYAHAQNNYFEGSIYDEQFRPKYKYVDGVGAEEFTEEEKTEFYPIVEPEPVKSYKELYEEQLARNDDFEAAIVELSNIIGGEQ